MRPPRTSRLGFAAALLCLASVAPPRAEAQPPPRQPTPNDTLKSTEVAPDRKVTFRIYAPKAEEVSVSGDWARPGPEPAGKMQKDDQGVWSVTVGPLAADYYTYTFTVDGVRTVDPKNPAVKQGVSNLESIFEVPGEESAFQANRDVPHGEVRAVLIERVGTTNTGDAGGDRTQPLRELD